MKKDKDFARRIGRTLDRQGVDAATRAELRAARRNALDGAGAPARRRWVPAGAVAGLALALTAALLYRGEPIDTLPALPDDELALIAAEDDLELLEEWEFYAWFDAQEDGSG